MTEITNEDRTIERELLAAYEKGTNTPEQPVYARALTEGRLTAWATTDFGGALLVEVAQRYAMRTSITPEFLRASRLEGIAMARVRREFNPMAIANDALPDTDPRKITRADVDELLSLAKSAREPFGTFGEAILTTVAGKLRAILSP